VDSDGKEVLGLRDLAVAEREIREVEDFDIHGKIAQSQESKRTILRLYTSKSRLQP
jgi:hypothetical protein